VLPVTTIEDRAPVTLVIFVESDDLLLQRRGLSPDGRTYPLLVFLLDVGRHQRMIESVMRKQLADAITSGIKTEKCWASAASMVAASIQSWATLIMISMINRACQTAALPTFTFGVG